MAHDVRGRRRQVLMFGPFTFMPEEHELRRDGAIVHLQRQPAMVLAYLLEHNGRAVSRDELAGYVWHDGRHVGFDQGLNYCIRQVRRALDDCAATPRYIETVGRRGYRWIGGLCISHASPIGVGDPSAVSARRRRDWTIAAGSATATLAIALLVRLFAPVDAGPSVSTPERRPASHLELAVDALHVLSHAVFDPAREPEAEKALRTLWVVTASHVGLASEASLPR